MMTIIEISKMQIGQETLKIQINEKKINKIKKA